MAQGAEATQTLEASASTHTLTIEARSVGGQAAEVVASYVTNKKVAVVSAGRRTGVSSADTPSNLNSATWNAHASILDVSNSSHVNLSARFSVAGASAVIMLALYDAQATPALIDITREYPLTADTSWPCAGSGQMYPAFGEPVDVHVASKIVAIVKSLSSGNVDIMLEPI